MHSPLEPQPRQRRYSVRHQVRLDSETYAKLDELVTALYQKRAAILRVVMGWGLTHGKAWTVDLSIPDRPHLVHMLVEPDLLQQVQDAAESYGVAVAVWLAPGHAAGDPERLSGQLARGQVRPQVA
jgi:hypothetical protein